jgi:hypothetical protein
LEAFFLTYEPTVSLTFDACFIMGCQDLVALAFEFGIGIYMRGISGLNLFCGPLCYYTWFDFFDLVCIMILAWCCLDSMSEWMSD